MKKLFLLIVLVSLSSCSKTDRNQPVINQNRTDNNNTALLDNLSKLQSGRRYFEMRDMLKSASIDNNTDLLFFSALVKCVFDETDSSIILFDKFLAFGENPAKKNLTMAAYLLQSSNYFKNENSKKSSDLLREYYSKYRYQIKKNELNILINNINIQSFETFARTSYHQNSTPLEMNIINRDPTRITVSVLLNGKEAEFILDTGSEVNSITEKNARKFGITEYNNTMYSSMITGTHKVHTGTIDSLTIGNLVVKKCIFFCL